MEAEFVNVFVQKQRDTINDLMSRCIMLETKLAVAEPAVARIGELEQQLAASRAEIELITRQYTEQSDQIISELRQQIATQNTTNQQLEAEIVRLNDELNTVALAKSKADQLLQDTQKKTEGEVGKLRKSINDLTLERETLKTKVDTLKKAL